MLCAKIPSELEAVEAHEPELTMAHVKYSKALREAAREKWLRNKHMRCSVCVRTKENPMRNKALTPVLVLGCRDRLCSNVTQFLQDINKVAAGSKTRRMMCPTCRAVMTSHQTKGAKHSSMICTLISQIPCMTVPMFCMVKRGLCWTFSSDCWRARASCTCVQA